MEYTAHNLNGCAIYFSQLYTFKSTASVLALGCLLMTASPSNAQNAGQPGASSLPAVTVDAPAQRAQRAAPQRRAATRSGESARRARQAANPSAQSQSTPAIVSTAERVSAGTKGFGATKTDA